MDAARLHSPVLFIQQWDDSLIPRAHSTELFEAIASPDKRLHAHPGDHSEVPPEELAFSAGFLADRLLHPRRKGRGPGVAVPAP